MEAPSLRDQPPFPIWLWLALVFSAWTVMHGLHQALLVTGPAVNPEVTLLGWTAAKLIAWMLPTAILVWRRAGPSSLRWLGLSTNKGLHVALLWSGAWIALQELGTRLRWPLFERPAPDLAVSHLVGALAIAPLFEEVMFRGAMLRALRERGVRREQAVLASSLAFAALHLPGWFARRGLDPSLLGSFAGIAVFGLVLGSLAWRTTSLWAPVALHLANNLLSTGALGWLMRTACASYRG